MATAASGAISKYLLIEDAVVGRGPAAFPDSVSFDAS